MNEASVEHESGAPARLISRSLLHSSPRTNPRQIFRGIEGLADSMREHGQIAPLVVRPSKDYPGGFDVGDGDRRLRAADLAGLDDLLCVVRDLSDRQMIEVALVGNKERDDLHPLEEAEGYRRLHVEHRVPVADIAAKQGRSEAYVYARLRLCALCTAVRDAFLADRMPLRAALALSRVASPEVQARAWSEVEATAPKGEPVRVDTVLRYVRERYMLRLADAPFPRKDASLVPEAGSCLACPKRTGNQPQLPLGGADDDVEAPKDDLCTDEPCFARKREAHASRLIADAKAKGRPVLDQAAAGRTVFKHGLNVVAQDSAYVDPASTCVGDLKSRTYKVLLGKHAPPTTLVIDRMGAARELYVKKDAIAALKAAGHDFGARTGRLDAALGQPQGKTKDANAEAAKRARVKAQGEAIDVALLAIAREAGKRGPTRKTLLLVAGGLVAVSWHDTLARYARRHELDAAGTAGNKAERLTRVLLAHAGRLDEDGLLGMIVELVVSRTAHEYDPKTRVGGGDFPQALAVFGVSVTVGEATAKKTGRREPKSAKRKGNRERSDDDEPGIRGDVCRVCGTSDLDVEEGDPPVKWSADDLCQGCDDLEAEVVREVSTSRGQIPVEALASRLGREVDVVAGAVLDLAQAGKVGAHCDGSRPIAAYA